MEDEIKCKPDAEFTALVLIDIAYEKGLINKETYLNIMKKYGKKYGWRGCRNSESECD